MKKVLVVMAAVVLVCAAAPVYAQNGCVNSPENPTALLALIGTAGAFMASLRGRLRR